jgi:hypothetical protein
MQQQQQAGVPCESAAAQIYGSYLWARGTQNSAAKLFRSSLTASQSPWAWRMDSHQKMRKVHSRTLIGCGRARFIAPADGPRQKCAHLKQLIIESFYVGKYYIAAFQTKQANFISSVLFLNLIWVKVHFKNK